MSSEKKRKNLQEPASEKPGQRLFGGYVPHQQVVRPAGPPKTPPATPPKKENRDD